MDICEEYIYFFLFHGEQYFSRKIYIFDFAITSRIEQEFNCNSIDLYKKIFSKKYRSLLDKYNAGYLSIVLLYTWVQYELITENNFDGNWYFHFYVVILVLVAITIVVINWFSDWWALFFLLLFLYKHSSKASHGLIYLSSESWSCW